MTEMGSEIGTSEVPIWPALLTPVLQVLGDGKAQHRKVVFGRAADVAGLSDTARSERLSTGGLRYEQRMGWVLSHLMRAGLLDRPTRGEYAINDAGRPFFRQYPNGMDHIGRDTIQAFAGALQGTGASRGVFITTSGFTENASRHARDVPSRVILIDGQRLVALMIKYRIGVQVKESYHVVALDDDFFD